jgi:hypothetical protein
MEVRDAVEADAVELAGLVDAPADVLRNLVHERTVRVLEADDDDVAGFVSYDARDGVVHVTQLAGTLAGCERLLEEPIGFADTEGMAVELLAPEDETTVQDAAENAGFDRVGTGPLFQGQRTVRFRRE